MEACVGAEGICVLTEVSFPAYAFLSPLSLYTSSLLILPIVCHLVGRIQDSRLAIDLRQHVETRHGVRRTRDPRFRRFEKDWVQGLYDWQRREPLGRRRFLLDASTQQK